VIVLKYVKFLREITKDDVPLVGGKAANLGEMIQKTKVPVPSGFAITAIGYWAFIKYNHLDEIIKGKISQIKSADDIEGIKKAGKEIREAILNSVFPEELKKEIIEAYNDLAEKVETTPFVAVRSSATAEDLEGASFAGQQETYLNVRGIDDLLEKTKMCIASLFTDRAIYYRIKKGFDHLKVALCVVVQLMVRSKVSGVMFTLDVRNGNRDVVMVEGSYGLGEYIVQGVVTPDTYVVNKKSCNILHFVNTVLP
jgi:pyruvate,water dikinase